MKRRAKGGRTTQGFITHTIKIIVTISSVVIESEGNKTSLYPEEIISLTAKINPTTATAPVSYKWTSDTPEVATVTDNAVSVTPPYIYIKNW